ncbi:MAG: hypothetical protein COA92_05715 [Sulfurovum sp.]|nr:MAG: hypothetical protein COA92_05715 [Sulfurovum sp.]
MSNLDTNMIDKNMIDYKITNRKTYIFEGTTYYKVIGMNSQYFLKATDCDKATLCQKAIKLYKHHAKSGMLKVNGYIKSMDYSDVLLIAAPSISSPFKMHDLEKTV